MHSPNKIWVKNISYLLSFSNLKSKLRILKLVPITLGARIWVAWLYKKRFYTRGTLRSKRISRLAKILTLYGDWLRCLKKERVNYLSCINGKGVVKTFTEVHKMPRYLLIYYRISFALHQKIKIFLLEKYIMHLLLNTKICIIEVYLLKPPHVLMKLL